MKGRNLISSFASVLLIFSYLTAIVGIDVHVDYHNGEVFVVSLLGHTDCESLHPDDVCHCVEHLHHHCHADDEDCENEISVISLTGDGSGFSFDFTPALSPLPVSPSVESGGICAGTCTDTEIHITPPGRYLKNLCVLRV